MFWFISQGFDEPAEPWFWSPRKTQAADDKEDEDEPKNQQDINREKGDDSTEEDENISEEIEFEVLNFFYLFIISFIFTSALRYPK